MPEGQVDSNLFGKALGRGQLVEHGKNISVPPAQRVVEHVALVLLWWLVVGNR